MTKLFFSDVVARANDVPETYEDCDVVWLEYPPRGMVREMGSTDPTWHMDSGCTVTVKRKTATVVRSNGEVMRKRLISKGFYFTPNAHTRMTPEEEDALLAKL